MNCAVALVCPVLAVNSFERMASGESDNSTASTCTGSRNSPPLMLRLRAITWPFRAGLVTAPCPCKFKFKLPLTLLVALKAAPNAAASRAASAIEAFEACTVISICAGVDFALMLPLRDTGVWPSFRLAFWIAAVDSLMLALIS